MRTRIEDVGAVPLQPGGARGAGHHQHGPHAPQVAASPLALAATPRQTVKGVKGFAPDAPKDKDDIVDEVGFFLQ